VEGYRLSHLVRMSETGIIIVQTCGEGLGFRGSEAGSYLRLIDFVYHSTLGLRVIKEDVGVSGGRGFGVQCSGGPRLLSILRMVMLLRFLSLILRPERVPR